MRNSYKKVDGIWQKKGKLAGGLDRNRDSLCLSVQSENAGPLFKNY
jgi:hypothetical protein